MTFCGWGLIGKPKEGVIVATGEGPGIDVSGYHDDYYWDSKGFLGPDKFGIVPIYTTRSGKQSPKAAKQYPYRN